MERNRDHNNGFMSGVMLGAILGGAGVFLLGTKKGNKILKILTEEGIDTLSEASELLSETYEEKKPMVEKAIHELPSAVEDLADSSEIKNVIKKAKRIFKQASK